jgi:radical SAM superfamily enzyme YgiQ (UPF0313 family)
MSRPGTPRSTPEDLERGYWVPDPTYPRGRRIVFPPETQNVINQMKREFKEKFPNLPFLIPIPFMPEEKFVPRANSPLRNRRYKPNYMKPKPLFRLTQNQMPPPLVFNNENENKVPLIKRIRSNTQKRKNRNKTRKSRN